VQCLRAPNLLQQALAVRDQRLLVGKADETLPYIEELSKARDQVTTSAGSATRIGVSTGPIGRMLTLQVIRSCPVAGRPRAKRVGKRPMKPNSLVDAGPAIFAQDRVRGGT
jgi:hypothetical protein